MTDKERRLLELVARRLLGHRAAEDNRVLARALGEFLREPAEEEESHQRALRASSPYGF